MDFHILISLKRMCTLLASVQCKLDLRKVVIAIMNIYIFFTVQWQTALPMFVYILNEYE